MIVWPLANCRHGRVSKSAEYLSLATPHQRDGFKIVPLAILVRTQPALSTAAMKLEHRDRVDVRAAAGNRVISGRAVRACHNDGERSPRGRAAFATHDLPTFAGWLRGGDLAIKTVLAPIRVSPARHALRQALSATQMTRYRATRPLRLVLIAIADIIEARRRSGTIDA
jgi:hypothetical protein